MPRWRGLGHFSLVTNVSFNDASKHHDISVVCCLCVVIHHSTFFKAIFVCISQCDSEAFRQGWAPVTSVHTLLPGCGHVLRI